MPIAAWWHPGRHEMVALGDEAAMADVVPPQFLRALLAIDRDDKRHQGPQVTVTAGLGCPRQTFIERALPATVDPLKRCATTMGTVLHAWLAKITSEHPNFSDWLIEGRDNGDCEVGGTLFGIYMTGKMDLHRCERFEVWDWKTSFSDKSAFVKADEAASQEHAAQLNMLRLLHAQMVGDGPDSNGKMVVIHVGRTFIRQECALMDEAAIGRVRPGSTASGQAMTTVRENFTLLKGAYDRWQAGDDVREVAASLPLVGETQWRSKKGTRACDNCAVRRTCEELASGGAL